MARKVSKKIWRPHFEETFIGPVQVKNALTPSQNFEAKCHRCSWASYPKTNEAGKRCILPIDAFYEWPTKGKGIPPVKIMLADRQPYAIAGLWSRWFDNGSPRFSFATFTVESNDFMLPLHPQAMPVILDSMDAQKEWLLNGNRDLLVPYTGAMVADEMPDTLEKLYPAENSPPKQKAQEESIAKKDEEIQQGSLFG